MAAPRLSAEALAQLDSAVALPGYGFAKTEVGHVHLGVGAFMRAFIATCSDAAMAASGGDWGIAGVCLRQATVRDQLVPQDCLYTLSVRDSNATAHQLVGAIRSVDVAPENPQRIVDLLAAPTVHIVTLTVTEKGYCIAPDSGDLDRSNPDLSHDLDDLENPRSTIGFLVAGLRRRRDTGAGPLTIVSCDNLPDNGSRLRRAVCEFADAVDPPLRTWIETSVTFPATMVDRIVPATTPEDIEEAARAIGVRDEALVKTEPFLQWVIEDRFCTERPRWEAGGALFVDDVEPYETAKLRLLNGAHSSLAYLGYLAGHDLISDAMQDPDIAAFIGLLMSQEISPVTPEPAGMEHATYIDVLLQRFRNAALGHRTWQIAMDGSQKLPQRLLNTVRSQLQRGGPIAGLSLAIAAWMRYVLGRDEAGEAIDVRDPMADTFRQIAATGDPDPERRVAQFTALHEVFGTDLGADRRFVATLAERYRLLLDQGASAAIRDYLAEAGSR